MASGRRVTGKVLWLDPAGAEEGVKIGGVETDVSVQLEVRDAALATSRRMNLGLTPRRSAASGTLNGLCAPDLLSLAQTSGNDCRQE